jgi:2-polyprenyl-6-methoxyphenol hydroxylase-like FAD-dependent oxidoreductase
MAENAQENSPEVVIAGAGTAGLALATALAQSLRPGFAVAVCDPRARFRTRER